MRAGTATFSALLTGVAVTLLFSIACSGPEPTPPASSQTPPYQAAVTGDASEDWWRADETAAESLLATSEENAPPRGGAMVESSAGRFSPTRAGYGARVAITGKGKADSTIKGYLYCSGEDCGEHALGTAKVGADGKYRLEFDVPFGVRAGAVHAKVGCDTCDPKSKTIAGLTVTKSSPQGEATVRVVDSYFTAFGRGPSAEEVKYWTGAAPKASVDDLVKAHRQWLQNNTQEREATLRRVFVRYQYPFTPGAWRTALATHSVVNGVPRTYAELVPALRWQVLEDGYQQVYRRAPGESEVAAWKKTVPVPKAWDTYPSAIREFRKSLKADAKGASGRDLVSRVFQNPAGHQPSPAELEVWSGELASYKVDEIGYDRLDQAVRAQVALVSDSYKSAWGRPPTTDELGFWLSIRPADFGAEPKKTLADIHRQFLKANAKTTAGYEVAARALDGVFGGYGWYGWSGSNSYPNHLSAWTDVMAGNAPWFYSLKGANQVVTYAELVAELNEIKTTRPVMINQSYQSVWGRLPTAGELNYWLEFPWGAPLGQSRSPLGDMRDFMAFIRFPVGADTDALISAINQGTVSSSMYAQAVTEGKVPSATQWAVVQRLGQGWRYDPPAPALSLMDTRVRNYLRNAGYDADNLPVPIRHALSRGSLPATSPSGNRLDDMGNVIRTACSTGRTPVDWDIPESVLTALCNGTLSVENVAMEMNVRAEEGLALKLDVVIALVLNDANKTTITLGGGGTVKPDLSPLVAMIPFLTPDAHEKNVEPLLKWPELAEYEPFLKRPGFMSASYYVDDSLVKQAQRQMKEHFDLEGLRKMDSFLLGDALTASDGRSIQSLGDWTIEVLPKDRFRKPAW